MGTNDTPPDELPLTSMSANGNSSVTILSAGGGGGGGGGHSSAAGKSSGADMQMAVTTAASVPHDPEECERLKPANGDHTAYGAAPNEVNHHHKACDHSSPLMDNSSNGSAPTTSAAGGSARFAGGPGCGGGTKRHSVMLTRGDTDLSIDHGGFQRFLPKFMHFTFADHEAENLYHEYYSNEKRSDFQALILIVILVNAVILLLHILACVCGKTAPNLASSASIRHLSIVGACLATVLLLCVLCLRRSSEGVASRRLWSAIPFVLWAVMLVQVVCDLWTYSGGVGPPEAGGGSMVWLLLYTYSTYVIFPLRFRHLSALSWAMAALYLLEVILSASKSYKFINQILANILLIICVNVLSMMSFFFYERQQRRAFLEARQSLEAKIILEEESEEQERLLLSVLPKHVAVEIRKDLGAVVEGQFHKIYMSRHENVSILFADIVGFTAFSSTVSAPELVKTLNELFARFDKLSEKYHQLRIKILGDCYYCISGAPQERPDHAVLCVHMGLSMVEAIKSVREQTKSGVDMRVGVHTGGVLAGVLGQRQWQFDVYSRDVEFANKMESGGLPGRVHISERTLSFLNGEFEVTDGDGASREEAIRLSGVKTYLIVKVIKPYPEGTLDANTAVADAANGGANANAPGTEDNETTQLAPCESSKPEPSQVTSEDIKDPAVYKERLHGELIHRDSQQVLGTHTHPLTLSFRDDALEASYRDCRDVTSVVGLCGLPLTLATVFLCYFLVSPLAAHLTLTFLLSALLLTLCAFILTVPVASSSVPKPFVMLSSAVQEKSWIRLIIAGTMLAIWVTVIVLLNCFYGDEHSSVHQQQLREGIPSTATPALAVGSRLPVTTFVSGSPNSPALANASVALPQYLLFFVLLCLLAITALTRISYLVKIGLVSGLVGGQAALLYLRLTASFRLYSSFNGLLSNLDIRHYYLAILLTVLVALVIIIRQFELMSRRLFLWQREVVEQREKVSDIRRKNEALVYNILPPHVAVHFLGKRKSDEELYSKSYECIAVLFASMPNFSDFYTEESVNNQGLECIRFLNEVISDYDQLLSQPRFKDIFKIKTISSTYMAAAGLNEEVVQIAENATDLKAKWHHLAQLTEFALTLKETLNFINKESFNNFVLRMGINQGPITAGVIGARKPHYDIWGNTVNVASRMESTGKAGCIQVIEETANILEQFGYVFEQRGLVSVKGKGKLMTYFLVGKKATSPK